MAELPERLHQRAYLVAYDPQRQRLLTRGSHHEMVNAAILAELYLDGLLQDDGGRARAQRPARGRLQLDPLPAQMFARIEESSPRHWTHWISAKAGAGYKRTRAELATGRVIRLEERRLLGVVPLPPRMTPANPLVVRELVERSRRVVLGPGPVERDDLRDTVLAALAVAVELPTVSSWPERRQHRDRIRAADDIASPVTRALRGVAMRNKASAG